MEQPREVGRQQNLFNVDTTKKQKQKSADDYVFDIVDALQGPILTFSTLWADSIPKRLTDNVAIARLKALMSGEQMATILECVIYIYTRTYEAPMDSEWVDIYTHISCKTLEEYFGENHWEDVKAPRQLQEWLQSKLDGLRRHIYNKRREIVKQRLRATEKDLPVEKNKEPITEEKNIQQKHPGLFPDYFNF